MLSAQKSKILKIVLKLLYTIGANALAVEINNVLAVSAEDTSGMIFFQYYAVVVNKYFNGILFLDIQNLSGLLRENDSAERVDLADNTCGFHNAPLKNLDLQIAFVDLLI